MKDTRHKPTKIDASLYNGQINDKTFLTIKYRSILKIPKTKN